MSAAVSLPPIASEETNDIDVLIDDETIALIALAAVRRKIEHHLRLAAKCREMAFHWFGRIEHHEDEATSWALVAADGISRLEQILAGGTR